MDTISVLTTILAALLVIVAFDVVAVLFGSDSRDPLRDDHQR